jgi:double-stranded uracil-DNA glycosylase
LAAIARKIPPAKVLAMTRPDAAPARPRANDNTLRSFAPFADANSRVLVLGTMPGPEALRRQEFYGFKGNHFWRIMIDLLAPGHELAYAEKLDLMRKNRIAIWDVLHSCERMGAADSAIRNARPNDIPGLLARHPRIGAIFCNGTTSARLFGRFFAGAVSVPMIPLPSTSPANAAMPYAVKRGHWAVVIARARAPSARAPATGSRARR